MMTDSVPRIEGDSPMETIATPSVTLTKDHRGKSRKRTWNFRFVIGILNFVAQSSCGEPKLLHEISARK